MNAPAIVQRHPALRWLAPAGVLCVAGLVVAGVFNATASPESLPRTTPTALIAALRTSDVQGFSGTMVSHLSLGLPELPALPAGDEETSFAALLSGSHTMQVWYGGPTKQRIALLGATDETDLFRNGQDVWQWSSVDGIARHLVLPKDRHRELGEVMPSTPAGITPLTLARNMLAAMDPSTQVRVERGEVVADRSAYDLVLTPRTNQTKVGSVHISVDGATKMPLGVSVFPRGSTSAAIDVEFTSIRFAAQPDRNFAFSPPPNARVVQETRTHDNSAPGHPAARTAAPATTGSGWAIIVRVALGKVAVTKARVGRFLKMMTPVSGAWGKGHVLDATLMSLLVTDNGRIFVGAVPPASLYAAAGAK
ncbi:MAG TPA: hypothetical protein VKB75_05095 [Jatrophihabitans sp.]|nr:hypothetical protein [Jatrophihabitans sp.]